MSLLINLLPVHTPSTIRKSYDFLLCSPLHTTGSSDGRRGGAEDRSCDPLLPPHGVLGSSFSRASSLAIKRVD